MQFDQLFGIILLAQISARVVERVGEKRGTRYHPNGEAAEHPGGGLNMSFLFDLRNILEKTYPNDLTEEEIAIVEGRAPGSYSEEERSE